MVALVTIFKFTSKHIAPLFVLQCISHYSFFLTFVVLVRSQENLKVRNAGIAVLKKTKPLHALFIGAIVVGYFFTDCSTHSVYPISFLIGDVLFFGMFFLVNRLKSADLKAAWGDNLSEKEAAQKNLSELQFKTFYGSLKMMAGWHALEVVLGKILFATLLEGAVTCGGEGKDWHYRSGPGHLFLMLHILGTMQALGVTRKVFIKNAQSQGVLPAKKTK